MDLFLEILCNNNNNNSHVINRRKKRESGGSSHHIHVLLVLVLLLLMLHVGDCTKRTTAAFFTLFIPHHEQGHERSSITRIHHFDVGVLWAKKKKNTKKDNNNIAANSSSSGGFGALASATTRSTTTTTPTTTISSSFGTGATALRKAANNYDEIRKRYGLKACCDVYVKSPLDKDNPNLYWFVGKIARQLPDVSESAAVSSSAAAGDDDENDKCDCCTPFFMEAVLFQKRLILDYSKMQLRPQNFGASNKYISSALELWLAPPDSEMNVATNKISLCGPVVRSNKNVVAAQDENDKEESAPDDGAAYPPPVSVLTVGYNPEIYLGDEIVNGGLRVERDENGNPTKAAFDVNESL